MELEDDPEEGRDGLRPFGAMLRSWARPDPGVARGPHVAALALAAAAVLVEAAGGTCVGPRYRARESAVELSEIADRVATAIIDLERAGTATSPRGARRPCGCGSRPNTSPGWSLWPRVADEALALPPDDPAARADLATAATLARSVLRAARACVPRCVVRVEELGQSDEPFDEATIEIAARRPAHEVACQRPASPDPPGAGAQGPAGEFVGFAVRAQSSGSRDDVSREPTRALAGPTRSARRGRADHSGTPGLCRPGVAALARIDRHGRPCVRYDGEHSCVGAHPPLVDDGRDARQRGPEQAGTR